MFQLELLLDIPMHLYEERSGSRLKDAYSTGKKLTLITEQVPYEKLRMCNQAKCRINRQEMLGEDVKILQVLGHQAKLQKKNRMAAEGGVRCEGVLEVQILYVTANDRQPFENVTLSVPYSQVVEIPGMTPQDAWKISENLEQLLISVPEGNQLEIRGVIQMNVCVMEQCMLENATAITEEAYDPAVFQKEPAMRIHFVQPGETLWSIAKTYRSTVEDIKKLNDFTAEDVMPGQKLLLLKSAAIVGYN
jgi:LysM repeat protein